MEEPSVIYWLMKALVRKNNTVYLIGHPQSSVADIGVKLIPVSKETDWRLLIPPDIDIVHTACNSVDLDMPYINTIHGNEKPGTIFPLNSVFVSQNHASRNHSTQFVYNGLDFEEYPLSRTRKFENKNYLFLANGRWRVKNLRDCIRASRQLKRNLFVAGAKRSDVFKVFRKGRKSDLTGLASFVSPYLHFQGMLEQSKKLPLLKKIDGLLWPVRWHEPFGLAIIEAFSQGIPVFASMYGSLPELVPDYCGVLSKNYDDFVNSLNCSTFSFDAQDIRQHCIRNFSSDVMAVNYLKLYEKILAGENINTENPYTDPYDDPENLLPF